MLLSKIFKTDSRVRKEVKTLIENGHQIKLIVWDRKNKLKKRENLEGIEIFRIQDNGLMKILPNDILKNPLWWRKAYKKGLEIKKEYDYDVVHCHDLDTLQAGVWIKRKTGCKLVYDAHEVFGYMIHDNVFSFFVKFSFYLEKKLVKNVDHIITVNEKVKKYFKNISTVPITLVMNCKDLISKTYTPSKNKIFTVCYIGNLHKRRLFPQIVDALGSIENIKFLIAAKKEHIKLYNQVEETANKFENVNFLGEIPSDMVIPNTLKSDIIVQPFDPIRKTAYFSTPNKLFEAMVCGRPIICNKGTNPGKIVEELECGITVDYDLDSFKKGVIYLRDNPELCEKLGKNSLKAAIEKYNWYEQKKNLLSVYKNFE
jgi:glycosyltransferase involved in cell wall biosynthesis